MQGNQERAIIYVRVSDPNEKSPYGLDTQREGCLTYATERGYQVVGVFEEKHTGKVYREREVLTNCRRMIRDGEANILLMYCVDRISRNQAHIYIIDEECRDHNARLEFATDQFEDSPEGRLLFAAKAFMAEVEREKIIERTTRGKRARVQSGKLLAGPRPLYGYVWRDDAKTALDPNPLTAPIVQRIYRRLLEGAALRQIARELTADNIPTPTGRHGWHPDAIRRILKHPGYCGNAYGWAWRHAPGRGHFDAENAIALPEGTIPALVTSGEWEAAQARLRYNQEHAPRNNQYPEDALMRGYVFCAVCGEKLYVERFRNPYQPTTNRRRKHDAGEIVLDYACRVRRPDGSGCRATSIRAKVIDDAAWAIVRSVMRRPAVIQDELRRLRENDPTEADLVSVENALKAVQREYSNFMRTIAQLDNPDDVAPLAAHIKALGERRRALEIDREEIQQRRANWLEAEKHLDDLSAWSETVADRIDSLDYNDRRALIELFGITATVHPKGASERYVIRTRFSADVLAEIEVQDSRLVTTTIRD